MARGQTVVSDGGLSSGKLVKAAATSNLSGAAGESPSSKVSKSRTPPSDSGRIIPPGMPPLPVRAASLVDTSPGANNPTMKGLGSGLRPGGSSSRISGKRRLPVARPLEEPPRASDFVLDDDLPASLSGFKAVGSSLKSGRLPTSLLGRKSTPMWVWLVALGLLAFAAMFVWAVWFFTHWR